LLNGRQQLFNHPTPVRRAPGTNRDIVIHRLGFIESTK